MVDQQLENPFLFHVLLLCFFQVVASGAAGRLHRDGDVEAQRQRGGPQPCPGGRIGREVFGRHHTGRESRVQDDFGVARGDAVNSRQTPVALVVDGSLETDPKPI